MQSLQKYYASFKFYLKLENYENEITRTNKLIIFF